jgi:hypothetical protein
MDFFEGLDTNVWFSLLIKVAFKEKGLDEIKKMKVSLEGSSRVFNIKF